MSAMEVACPIARRRLHGRHMRRGRVARLHDGLAVTTFQADTGPGRNRRYGVPPRTSMSTRRSSCHAVESLPVASSAPREVSRSCEAGTPRAVR